MTDLDPLVYPFDHLAKFYDIERDLYDSVTQFVGVGLQRGEGILLVATSEHLAAFKKQLEEKGLPVQECIRTYQLTLLDAENTLSQFIDEGNLQTERAKALLEGVLSRVEEKFPRVRVYGEMVSLLLKEGNLTGVVDLENLWNDLMKSHSFSLLCGYVMSDFDSRVPGSVVHQICQTHSHVQSATGILDADLPDRCLPDKRLRDGDLSDERLSQEQSSRMIVKLNERNLDLQRQVKRQRQIEEALQSALQVRDETFAIAGHELKTPLTSLQLQSQMFEAMLRNLAPELPGGLAKSLKIFRYSIGRMTRLVESFISANQIRLGCLNVLPAERLDLTALAGEMIECFKEQPVLNDKNLSDFITLQSEGPVWGSWNRVRIEQVISNLLSNAIHFGDKNRIEVQVASIANGNQARLVVRDFGVGIHAEDQSLIFDRFKRISGSTHTSGLGLGLYIVREIVKSYGGKVEVQSVPGEGSAFTIDLPTIYSPSFCSEEVL